jgi:hypothetical protein
VRGHDSVGADRLHRPATLVGGRRAQPGRAHRVDRRTLALDAGEWRLRCTIPTHVERGMTAALTVTG